MKTKYLLNLLVLFAFCALLIPSRAQALTVPPADMFQLPWEQGLSWIAMDGLDNGTRRLPTSPHNFNMGGAVDFAPHVGMKIGEDTSNAWVTAAAAGTVFETSSCHIKIRHADGWTTEYYHLGNIQVKVGSVVSRNQRLAIIHNNEKEQVCVGNRWPGPHLHFVLRPNMRDATLAGWTIKYDQKANFTSFIKNGQVVGLFQPILNNMNDVVTRTPSPTPAVSSTPTVLTTFTPTPTLVVPQTASPTPGFITPPPVFSPTPTPFAPDATNTPTPIFVPTDATATPTPIFTPTDMTATPTPIFTPTDAPTSTPIFIPTETVTPFFTPTDVFPTPTFIPTTVVTPTQTMTAVPTSISGLHVVAIATPASMLVGNTSQIRVYLNNVPAEGLTSVEFTCNYDSALLEANSIAITDLFGADAVMAVNGPQSGRLIVAVAGSNGRRATTSGIALTFNLKGRQIGQSFIVCTARVSKGDNLLMDIPHVPANLIVYGNMSTPTPTASLPPSVTMVQGRVFAGKPVTIRLYNADNSIAASTLANMDGSFSLNVASGLYTISAIAEGCLSAQGSVTIATGNTSVMPAITLPAGDIDGNGVIDQFDAMTIGMSYGTAFPAVADLNNDGTINVLDLELLAANYHKSGALMWQ